MKTGRLVAGRAGSTFLMWLVVAVAACCSAAEPQPPPPIRLTNHHDGSTIRYPVPLLRGTLADASASSIVVVNLSSKRDTRELKGLVHKGRFKALTELVPGENRLVLRAGRHELPLRLTYKPQTNPHVVRAIYLTDNTGSTEYQTPLADDPQDFAAKLDTAMKLLQTFTAESLDDLGLGRRTFNLQFDGDGKVKVHVLKGDQPAAHYHKLSGHQLYGAAGRLVHRRLPRGPFKNLVIPAFTRLDPKSRKLYAHTALGGGNQALFGGGDLFAWPSRLADVQKAFLNPRRVDPRKIFSDSVGRHTFWAIASTTIGACLHELGHTFGLPHSYHPHDIMTRGIDRLNRAFTFVDPPHARRRTAYEFRDNEVGIWAPVSAVMLWPSRWLALDDRPWKGRSQSAFVLDKARAALDISCGNGIRGVALHKGDAYTHYPVPADQPAPRRIEIPLAWLGRRLGTDNFSVRIRDAEAHFAAKHIKDLLPSPYVQSWRFAPTMQPWRNARQFAPMTDAKLDAIVGSAVQARLVASKDRFVDFLPRFPGGRRAYVAGYVVRRVTVPRPIKARILTGSDDALRLWLNGKLIRKVLALRSATPDQEATEVRLRSGENTLVAEVSQAGGGWGLYLRIEDANGTPLLLTESGELQPFVDKSSERIRALLRGPFVRAWRFASTTYPWTSRSAFVPMSPEKLRTIEASAAKAKLVRAKGAVVDFRPHFRPGRRSNVAGYAVRTLRSDKTRKVTLHTGSDDALRVWLNGKLITQVLALRGAKADSEAASATLRAGANRLVVEVSQGLGDWGLVLRLEDADGADLFVADDGTLTRVQPPTGR